MVTYLKVHDRSRFGTSGETEIYININHIVQIAPQEESAAITLSTGVVRVTVESYHWVIEELTGEKMFKFE